MKHSSRQQRQPEVNFSHFFLTILFYFIFGISLLSFGFVFLVSPKRNCREVGLKYCVSVARAYSFSGRAWWFASGSTSAPKIPIIAPILNQTPTPTPTPVPIATKMSVSGQGSRGLRMREAAKLEGKRMKKLFSGHEDENQRHFGHSI
nr:type IV inositol polyphosphate 5-phosphatase 3-like isoform X1 [Ipomoea batatas]